MDRGNLVLARVGKGSLHSYWLDPAQPRDWDLVLVPYEDIGAVDHLDCRVTEVTPGPKWSGVREVLTSWHGWRDYDYVWIPDDDLLWDQARISDLFRIGRVVGLDLFAPALSEASHFAHFSTMRNRSFDLRWTGFVEIMMPAFSVKALETLLPTLDLTATGYGWGLDSLWPKILGYRNVGIIDRLPVLHTRPVGALRDAQLARRVLDECLTLIRTYDCPQVHTTFGAAGSDLRRVEADSEPFFASLVDGWRYLVEKDPRILMWVIHYQHTLLRWPNYPVFGTPC